MIQGFLNKEYSVCFGVSSLDFQSNELALTRGDRGDLTCKLRVLSQGQGCQDRGPHGEGPQHVEPPPPSRDAGNCQKVGT